MPIPEMRNRAASTGSVLGPKIESTKDKGNDDHNRTMLFQVI